MAEEESAAADLKEDIEGDRERDREREGEGEREMLQIKAAADSVRPQLDQQNLNKTEIFARILRLSPGLWLRRGGAEQEELRAEQQGEKMGVCPPAHTGQRGAKREHDCLSRVRSVSWMITGVTTVMLVQTFIYPTVHKRLIWPV